MSTEPSHSNRPRRKSVLWLLLIPIALLIVTVQGFRLYLNRQVQTELAALQREGYPTDGRTLQNWRPPVPDKENFALRIMDSAEHLNTPSKNYSPDKWPTRAEELGPADRDALKELLTNNAAALNTLHQGSQLRQSRFFIDFSLGPNALLPHLAKIKALSHLLKAEALIATEEGQTDLAVRSVLDGVALARSLDTEPILISQLVRAACLGISCSSLERLLNQQALSEPQLAALAAAIGGAREASVSATEGALVGETCLGTFCFRAPSDQLFQMFDQGEGTAPLAQALAPVYRWSGLRERDFAFFLHTMHQLLQSAKTPFPERLDRAAEVANGRAMKTDSLLIFSRMLLPGIQNTTEKTADGEARLRCAEAVLMVERARLANGGTLPVAAGQWTGEKLPLDPFDGAPLRFRQRDHGYVVYSIGPDRTDNGGAERVKYSNPKNRKRSASDEENGAQRQPSNSYDITFAVER